MKYDALLGFQKQLRSAASVKQLAPVYLLQSREQFERERAAEQVLKAIDQVSGGGGITPRVFEGGKLEVGALLQELNTIPLFSSCHVVMIQDAEGCRAPVTERLLEYLKHPFESIFLILTASGVRSNSKLYRQAAEVGVVLDVKAQRPWQQERALPSWVVEEAARLGARVGLQVATELVQQVGTDKVLLCRELEKLCCYVGERSEIARDDVHAISLHTRSASVWDLGKAIFSGHPEQAIGITRNLLQDGQPLPLLLRQLRSQFQTDAQVCSILITGGTSDEVAKEFPYMRGGILQQHMQVAKQYGMARFKRGLILIDEAELLSRNSMASPEWLMEMLLVRLATSH